MLNELFGRDEPEKEHEYRDLAFKYPFAYDQETLINEYRRLYSLVNSYEEEPGHNGIAKNVLYVIPRLKLIIAGFEYIDRDLYEAAAGGISEIVEAYREWAEEN